MPITTVMFSPPLRSGTESAGPAGEHPAAAGLSATPGSDVNSEASPLTANRLGPGRQSAQPRIRRDWHQVTPAR